MLYRSIIGWIFVTGLSLALSSCGHYLEAKPDEKWALPSTAQDLQQLMDNYSAMNAQYPAAGEMMADNYYITADDWSTLSENSRDIYLWQKNDQTREYWAYPPILNANVVLDNVDKITVPPVDSIVALRNLAKGSALFFRAVYFHALVQLFATPYDKTTAAKDNGIPLRLTSSYKEVSVRATVQQTYDRIIMDLQAALPLLPATPQLKSRPSRPAVLGALARVYLDMRDYTKAAAYADSCLRLYNTLLDYNTLNATADAAIPRFSPEVILDMISPASSLLSTINRTDTTLYNSYAGNDLRKSVYFLDNDAKNFKGDYAGMGAQNGYIFAGIVTDEMYLIRAEGRARAGSAAIAMQDLNTLLEKRWRTGTFVPLTAANATEALTKILTERRKELLFRGTRWTDLRRLQHDPILAITPTRLINGQSYTLPPHSPRYTLQIPADVIALTNIPQNP